jgi:hypothetical protein
MKQQITAILGGVSTAGLRVVLGSMELRHQIVADVKTIVKISISEVNVIVTSCVNRIGEAMACFLITILME